MKIKGNEKNKIKSKKRIKIEFSKLVMAGMMSTYFVGLVFGIWAIIKLFNYSTDTIYMALGALFTYIAAPVSISSAFYSNKAKAENVLKIKNTQEREIYLNQFRDDDDYSIDSNIIGTNIEDMNGGIG